MTMSLYSCKLNILRDRLFKNIEIVQSHQNLIIQISLQNVKMLILYHIPVSVQLNRGYELLTSLEVSDHVSRIP